MRYSRRKRYDIVLHTRHVRLGCILVLQTLYIMTASAKAPDGDEATYDLRFNERFRSGEIAVSMKIVLQCTVLLDHKK